MQSQKPIRRQNAQHKANKRSQAAKISPRRKELGLETLEARKLMAADFGPIPLIVPNTGDAPALVAEQNPLDSSLGVQITDGIQFAAFNDATRDSVSNASEDGKEDPVKAESRRAGRWYINLSPAIRSSIVSVRDLKQFSERELSAASGWAIVTNTPKQVSEQLQKLKPLSITDRSDLFRGQIQSSVLEVTLHDSEGYGDLLKLLPVDEEHVLDVLPLFSHREQATGTLDASTVTDNAFPLQWHLDPTSGNTQYGIDAETAWQMSTGEGVTLAVVDSRQDINHPDLANNNDATLNYDDANLDWDGDGVDDSNPNVFLPGGSINYPNINDTDTDGDGVLDDDQIRQQSHGTAVAGLALGDDEGSGIVGVAPDATYAAFNFLDAGPNQSQSIPDTFSNGNIAGIDVFNNSWGVGNSRELRNRSFLELQAVHNAATDAIFIKSAGNNRDAVDSFQGWDRANYDALHMRQTLIVAAGQQDGRNDWYSNPGSNVLITAPVNRTGAGNSLTADVTDGVGVNGDNRGYQDGNLNANFNGTSAAAPMVSGTVALMLEVNPDLNWRDVQHILVDTAQKNGLIDADGDGVIDGGDADADGSIDNINLRTTFQTTFDLNGDGSIDATVDTDFDGNRDPYHTGWFQNGAGNWVSDSYGFGMIDANLAVRAARSWTTVEPELHLGSQKRLIYGGEVDEGALGEFESLSDIASFSTESKLKTEWVEITVNAEAPDLDELMLVLRSPSGTRSVLMAPGGSTGNADINNFTFSTNQFWDESAKGTWTLQALDVGVDDGQTIKIEDWTIDIYGSCCDTSPLQITSLAESGMSLDSFAELALAAGGLESQAYTLNEVKQIGDARSMGVFEKGIASDLPMEKGLIFSSGLAEDAIGPNDRPDTTTDWRGSGHQLLDNITGTDTRDASGLGIYLSVREDSELTYDALFGSEEFDEWVGSVFNDGAGIFVAQLKSRDQVFDLGAVTNVLRQPNGGKMTVNELAIQEGSGIVAGKFYDPNPVCGDMNWEYDGSSELTRTESFELQAGQHYYVGLMVADGVDGLYDSGLAISLDQAGSPTVEGDREKRDWLLSKTQVASPAFSSPPSNTEMKSASKEIQSEPQVLVLSPQEADDSIVLPTRFEENQNTSQKHKWVGKLEADEVDGVFADQMSEMDWLVLDMPKGSEL